MKKKDTIIDKEENKTEFKILSNPDVLDDDIGIDKIKKSEQKSESKYKLKQKEKEVKLHQLDFLPVLVMNIIFNRFKWQELKTDESEQLSKAFGMFVESLPPKIIAIFGKGTGVMGLLIVVYSLVSSRMIDNPKEKEKTVEEVYDETKEYKR